VEVIVGLAVGPAFSVGVAFISGVNVNNISARTVAIAVSMVNGFVSLGSKTASLGGLK